MQAVKLFSSTLAQAPRAVPALARGFATNEKAVKGRMKTVGNIRKITKAMKMVAASKLRADERRLNAGRPFTRAGVSVVEEPKGIHVLPEHAALQSAGAEAKPASSLLLVPISSDRGLCGGINSSIARETKGLIQEAESKGVKTQVLTVGDKGKSALQRQFADRFVKSITESWKAPVNFLTASAIADRVLQAPQERIQVIFNKFKSLIVFNTTVMTIPSKKALDDGRYFERTGYDIEGGAAVQQDLYEFYVANAVYNAMLENATSEQSARMTAMDNASKNAGEMLDKLRLQYNKARQSRITMELIEIISGANAV